MRSLEESRRRWQTTLKHATTLDELKKSVRLDGDESPCNSGLRSVCWKTFLLFQTTEVTGWSRNLVDSRGAYASLREHLLRYIENPDELRSALDPLDDDRHSPWNTLRQDEEIRTEIFQDVERCMPEEPYFRRPETQRLMLDILFIFCKINQDIGYRQGMHELLAPILWVVEQDAIDYGNDSQLATVADEDGLLKQTLDPSYIEHDAFTLLSLIMRTAKSFYELGEPDKRSTDTPSGNSTPQNGSSPIVDRSKRIHEVYLAHLDPALAKHLTDIEVLPQIFLIRWIRLLFGREFPFDDLLALWDVLLAEDPELDLVDMVSVAMLLRIRWQLIDANYSVALMLLLKYPAPSSPDGPKTFVDDAIYLRDNFNISGGNTIIAKYSGRNPPQPSLISRPSTPHDHSLNSRQKLLRTRSPLISPARFLQQQGGVEAILQGAARGVFDRGEKLGFNQAVRDAVGEVKKNMQGLQSPRPSSSRRTSDVMRWSLDEGRTIPSPAKTITAMNNRNQQLAHMLEQAMAELRAIPVSSDSAKDEYIKAVDLAVAKVEFVKIYLEDSTMPLPSDDLQPSSPSIRSDTPCITASPRLQVQSPLHSQSVPSSPAPRQVADQRKPTATLTPNSEVKPASSSLPIKPIASAPTMPHSPIQPIISPPTPSPSTIPIPPSPSPQPTPTSLSPPQARPTAPVPTRSSIANSSFSWMLEPDVPSSSASSPSGITSSSSPSLGLKTGKRNEKSAFLFGDEDAADGSVEGASASAGGERPEGFRLGTYRGKKD